MRQTVDDNIIVSWIEYQVKFKKMEVLEFETESGELAAANETINRS